MKVPRSFWMSETMKPATRGAPKRGGGAAGLQPPKTPKPKFKKTDFVDFISKLLRDFPFGQNQPLKSADD
jgi:hypothetical protein